MIDRVEIRNYQSLENVDLELGTLTVIVGPNDVGKSAVFRAVRAAAEAASGVEFITAGKTATQVTLHVDGRTLVWQKGKMTNRYSLDDELFDRIGRQIPPDIDEVLSMSVVDFGEDLKLSLNFADQDDPPFLIPYPGGMTAANVAKVLGDLTNLNLLFRAVAHADGKRKAADSQVKHHELEIQRTEEQLAAYSGLDDRLTHATELVLNTDRMLKIRVRREALARAIDDREGLRRQHLEIEQRQNALIDPKPLAKKVEDLLTEESRAKHFRDVSAQIQNLLINLGGHNHHLDILKTRLMDANQELADMMVQLKQCPLCDQPLIREHAHT